jgi:hypothetical protein
MRRDELSERCQNQYPRNLSFAANTATRKNASLLVAVMSPLIAAVMPMLRFFVVQGFHASRTPYRAGHGHRAVPAIPANAAV